MIKLYRHKVTGNYYRKSGNSWLFWAGKYAGWVASIDARSSLKRRRMLLQELQLVGNNFRLK